MRSSSSIFLFGLCFIFCLKKSNRTWKKLNNKPPHFTPTRRGLLILQPLTCVSGIEQVFKLPFLRYFSYHEKSISGQIFENKSSFYYNRMVQYFEGENCKRFYCFCSSVELNQRVPKSTRFSWVFLHLRKKLKEKNRFGKTVNKSPYFKEA